MTWRWALASAFQMGEMSGVVFKDNVNGIYSQCCVLSFTLLQVGKKRVVQAVVLLLHCFPYVTCKHSIPTQAFPKCAGAPSELLLEVTVIIIRIAERVANLLDIAATAGARRRVHHLDFRVVAVRIELEVFDDLLLHDTPSWLFGCSRLDLDLWL